MIFYSIFLWYMYSNVECSHMTYWSQIWSCQDFVVKNSNGHNFYYGPWMETLKNES